jgi:ribonuclease PH
MNFWQGELELRTDGRLANELRPIRITTGVNKFAEGSVLIECGDTRVLCTATVDDKVPPFMKGQGKGWVTAEYAMLPRATQMRNQRESARGKLSGRTMEIQRLIGRALRSVVNLEALGERTVMLDCDVLQADGGTRTTSISGAFVAMTMAIERIAEQHRLPVFPITDYLSSISVGIVDGQALLDLNYEEDSRCKVDMNVVMTGRGQLVELQGTGEESPFSREELDRMLGLAEAGIRDIIEIQKQALGSIGERIGG